MGSRSFDISEDYAESQMRRAVARILENIGFSTVHEVALDTLTDIGKKFLQKMWTDSKSFAEHGGRTRPVMQDAQMVFLKHQLNLGDLQDYMHQVESNPLPEKVPLFPSLNPPAIRQQIPSEKESVERSDSIPPYLPALHPEFCIDQALSKQPLSIVQTVHSDTIKSNQIKSSNHNEMWLKSHFPDFTGLSAINLGFLSKADLKLAIDQSDDVANNDNKDLSKFSAQNISISNKQKKKLSIEEAAKKLLAAQQANSCNNFLKALSTQENSSTEKQHSERTSGMFGMPPSSAVNIGHISDSAKAKQRKKTKREKDREEKNIYMDVNDGSSNSMEKTKFSSNDSSNKPLILSEKSGIWPDSVNITRNSPSSSLTERLPVSTLTERESFIDTSVPMLNVVLEKLKFECDRKENSTKSFDLTNLDDVIETNLKHIEPESIFKRENCGNYKSEVVDDMVEYCKNKNLNKEQSEVVMDAKSNKKELKEMDTTNKNSRKETVKREDPHENSSVLAGAKYDNMQIASTIHSATVGTTKIKMVLSRTNLQKEYSSTAVKVAIGDVPYSVENASSTGIVPTKHAFYSGGRKDNIEKESKKKKYKDKRKEKGHSHKHKDKGKSKIHKKEKDKGKRRQAQEFPKSKLFQAEPDESLMKIPKLKIKFGASGCLQASPSDILTPVSNNTSVCKDPVSSKIVAPHNSSLVSAAAFSEAKCATISSKKVISATKSVENSIHDGGTKDFTKKNVSTESSAFLKRTASFAQPLLISQRREDQRKETKHSSSSVKTECKISQKFSKKDLSPFVSSSSLRIIFDKSPLKIGEIKKVEGKQSENYMEQFKQKKNEQIKDKVKLVKNNSNQKAYEDEQMKQSKGLEGGHHSHSKESKNLDEVAKQFKEGKTSYGDKRRLSDRSNEEDEEAKKFEVIGVGVIEQLRGNKKENLKKKQLKLAKEFISNKRRYRGKKKIWMKGRNKKKIKKTQKRK